MSIRARARSVVVALALVVASRTASAEEPPPVSESVPAVSLPARIDEVRIEGLIRTHRFVVEREIEVRPGDVLTQERLNLGVTRLWNTTIFARVDVTVTRDGERNVLLVRVEDKWTLNPLFRFGSGGDTFYLRVGAADNNVAGRYIDLKAQYEYFNGYSGGQAVFRNPRLFDRRLELIVQVDRLVRPRQGFADQRTQGIVELGQLVNRDRMRFGIRGSVFANRFLAPLEAPRYFPAPTDTLLIEPSFRIGRVDVVRIRQRGVSLELRPGVATTNSDVADAFATMTAELFAFGMLGDRWNLAFRTRAANVTKVPAHLEHWLGGLDLLRGFPDNYVRTRAFVLGNFEARFIAFDSTWVAIVPTGFVDAVAARSPSGPAGTALSVGAGVRLLIPKFVGSGLRADLAIPVHADLRPVTALEQASFGPVTPRADIGSLQPSFGIYQFF